MLVFNIKLPHSGRGQAIAYLLSGAPVLSGSAQTSMTFSKELRRRDADLIDGRCSASSKPGGRDCIGSVDMEGGFQEYVRCTCRSRSLRRRNASDRLDKLSIAT